MPLPRLLPRPALATLPILLISLVLFALPLGWMALSLLADPHLAHISFSDSFRISLLARTLLYSLSAGVLATLLAIPTARVLARGGGSPLGRISRALLLVTTPASLLIPSLVYAYGWKQTLRLLEISLDPAGPLDVLRCIFTLAAWLWGLVAICLALAWRRIDASIELQARLDGASLRITARLLATPLLLGTLVVTAIASQEFSIFEPTGISVTATETRTVFDSGAFSTPTLSATPAPSSQSARAAAALRTALPSLLVTLLLAAAAYLLARHLLIRPDGAPDELHTSEVSPLWHLAAWLTLALTLLTPLAALLLSLKDPASFLDWTTTFAPQLTGSLTVAVLTFLSASLLAAVATLAPPHLPPRLPLLLAVVTFLTGGLLTAIALIRIYNNPLTAPIYDSAAIALLAYLARFGFLALLAAHATFSPSLTRLRTLAHADGATPLQTTLHVILPATLPSLLSAAAAVALLSLGELPATTLLAPQHPPLLTPLIMTWVHIQRYDPMIQASLLLTAVVLVISVITAILSLVFQKYRSIG